MPRAIFLSALVVSCAVAGLCSAQPSAPGPNPNAPIAEIRIEGNLTIPDRAILSNIGSRVGRRPNERQVLKDLQKLHATKWFFDIRPIYRATERGLVLVFRVTERPAVRKIEYRGNRAVSDRFLQQLTGLRPGSPFSVETNRICARRIERELRSKGYLDAKVKLTKGEQLTDREVIFEIDEGYEHVVGWVRVKGAKISSAAYLKTKLQTKSPVLFLIGGKYDADLLADDEAVLRDFYYKLGFFDVAIKKDIQTRTGTRPLRGRRMMARVKLHDVTYNINEGPRYVVRSITLKGNKVFSTPSLSKDFRLKPKQFFDSKKMTKDVDVIRTRYQATGRTFAAVEVKPKFTDRAGVVDLVYNVSEDKVRYIRDIKVRIKGDYPRTRESVVLNWLKLQQGDRADMKKIRASRLRLRGNAVFDPAPGVAPEVKVVKVADDWQGEPVPEPPLPKFRGQNNALPSHRPGSGWVPPPSSSYRKPIQRRQSLSELQAPVRRQSMSSTRTARYPDSTVAKTSEPVDVHFLESTNMPAPISFRGQNPGPLGRPDINRTPLYEANPSGDPLADIQPDPPGYIDLDITVNEAQTGRFMFGVAVNSDAGLVGQLSIEERNFDLFRLPRSWADVMNGTAFRGAGQTLRIEAMPGNRVSRYLVSWTDPFIFNTDYSLSVSGFYFQRFYPGWEEERGGGRVSIGRQITPDLSVTMGLRLEHVVVSNPQGAPPPQLAAVVGDSFLSTYKLTVTHDTRDSPYVAGEGHLWRASYEQAFGEFAYPMFQAEARHYFTAYSRPDDSGRHIISAGVEAGWTNHEVPIYERFFAGGFQTFRGFAFRGVSPIAGGVRIGGQFQFLGSVEYLMPITASDALGMVFFTDFGTVANNIDFSQFRVTAGFGFRVQVPAMGRVPLAFDFAFPILTEAFDDERLFSFFIGFTR